MTQGLPSGSPGRAGSPCTTLPSWMFDRSPITMPIVSPRSTQLYQTELSAPISTSPTSTQPGATKALSWIRGVWPLNGMMRTPGGGVMVQAPNSRAATGA